MQMAIHRVICGALNIHCNSVIRWIILPRAISNNDEGRLRFDLQSRSSIVNISYRDGVIVGHTGCLPGNNGELNKSIDKSTRPRKAERTA